jgi:hypothetical protein
MMKMHLIVRLHDTFIFSSTHSVSLVLKIEVPCFHLSVMTPPSCAGSWSNNSNLTYTIGYDSTAEFLGVLRMMDG